MFSLIPILLERQKTSKTPRKNATPPTNGGRCPSQGMVPGTGMRSSYGGNQGWHGRQHRNKHRGPSPARRPRGHERHERHWPGPHGPCPGHMAAESTTAATTSVWLRSARSARRRQRTSARPSGTTKGENVKVLWVVHFFSWMLLVGMDLYAIWTIGLASSRRGVARAAFGCLAAASAPAPPPAHSRQGRC